MVTRLPVKKHCICCIIIRCCWHVSYENTPCLHWNQKRGSKSVLSRVWSVFIQWRSDIQLRGSTWQSLELSQPPTSVSGPAVEWSGITGTNSAGTLILTGLTRDTNLTATLFVFEDAPLTRLLSLLKIWFFLFTALFSWRTCLTGSVSLTLCVFVFTLGHPIKRGQLSPAPDNLYIIHPQ